MGWQHCNIRRWWWHGGWHPQLSLWPWLMLGGVDVVNNGSLHRRRVGTQSTISRHAGEWGCQNDNQPPRRGMEEVTMSGASPPPSQARSSQRSVNVVTWNTQWRNCTKWATAGCSWNWLPRRGGWPSTGRLLQHDRSKKWWDCVTSR
jgi:hypothetical protein